MDSGIQVRRWVAALFVIIVFVVGGLIGSLATAKAGGGRSVPILVAAGNNRAGDQVSFQNGFAPVAKEVAPAVVNISSTTVVRTPRSQLMPFFNDPFFRQFFGNQFPFDIPRERRETALGSGVIVNPDGYILTNNHVVGGATDVKVYLNDKREFKARIVGADQRTDLAIIKVDTTSLPVLRFGDSSKVQVGDFCLAVGNPFGIGQTVTMGIVSATGRGGLGIEAYEDFIQTDAAINPGNSGGALVNERGELIGVNTAILSGSGGNQGIGFAIAGNMARSIMDQIIKHGKVVRAYMGIYPQEVTADVARTFGLSQPRGILVGDVEPNSPAARAGFERGDILLEMNGKPISDVNQFRIQIGMMQPGAQVRFRVFRNGSERDVTATLAEMPAQQQRRGRRGGQQEQGSALEGLSLDNLTPDIARQIGVPPNTKGVVVTDVAPGSAAEEAGLRRGDVIMEVNRKPVANVDEFERAVRAAGRQSLLLLVNTGGTTHYVTVQTG